MRGEKTERECGVEHVLGVAKGRVASQVADYINGEIVHVSK